MTHKKLPIVPQSSRPSNPKKTDLSSSPSVPSAKGPSKGDVHDLIEKTKELVGKNPDKAARVLSGWIKESTRKKAA